MRRQVSNCLVSHGELLRREIKSRSLFLRPHFSARTFPTLTCCQEQSRLRIAISLLNNCLKNTGFILYVKRKISVYYNLDCIDFIPNNY